MSTVVLYASATLTLGNVPKSIIDYLTTCSSQEYFLIIFPSTGKSMRLENAFHSSSIVAKVRRSANQGSLHSDAALNLSATYDSALSIG
jgi:hypothetical protein